MCGFEHYDLVDADFRRFLHNEFRLRCLGQRDSQTDPIRRRRDRYKLAGGLDYFSETTSAPPSLTIGHRERVAISHAQRPSKMVAIIVGKLGLL